MTFSRPNTLIAAIYPVTLLIVCNCLGNPVDRAGIIAHQDQLQNLVMDFDETRTFDIDPADAAKAPPNFRQVQVEPKRTEEYTHNFKFLNGCAYYERKTAAGTLKYWADKGLPAIDRQIQTVSAEGRIEELTDQFLSNGDRASFGELTQLNKFAPDVTIDIAMGLRLLGGSQWLTKADLNSFEEVNQDDPSIVVLRAKDGSGHVHEMRYDRRLLYAMTSYRCTGASGGIVEIDNSDFQRFGNVFIPGKMLRSSNLIDSNGKLRHPLTFSLTLTHASVNALTNTSDAYAIAWPAGMKLFDSRTNDAIEVGPTTRPLSDDDIRQQLADKKSRKALLNDEAARRINAILENEPALKH